METIFCLPKRSQESISASSRLKVLSHSLTLSRFLGWTKSEILKRHAFEKWSTTSSCQHDERIATLRFTRRADQWSVSITALLLFLYFSFCSLSFDAERNRYNDTIVRTFRPSGRASSNDCLVLFCCLPFICDLSVGHSHTCLICHLFAFPLSPTDLLDRPAHVALIAFRDAFRLLFPHLFLFFSPILSSPSLPLFCCSSMAVCHLFVCVAKSLLCQLDNCCLVDVYHTECLVCVH